MDKMVVHNLCWTVVAVILVLISTRIHSCSGIMAGNIRHRHDLFQDLMRRGKSFFSRSTYEIRRVEDPHNSLHPEHRGNFQGVEVADDGSVYYVNGATGGGHSYQNVHTNHDDDKNPNKGYNLVYHTDIVEHGNTDLYSMIGGLSFASVLATTLYMLRRNRNNGGNRRSYKETSKYFSNNRRHVKRNVQSFMGQSTEEFLTKLLSPPSFSTSA